MARGTPDSKQSNQIAVRPAVLPTVGVWLKAILPQPLLNLGSKGTARTFDRQKMDGGHHAARKR